MHRPSIPRHIIGLAVAVAVIIPIAICLVLGVAALLSAMGDASGGGVLRWIVLGFGILWALDLVLLILGLSVNVLSDSDDSDSHEQ